MSIATNYNGPLAEKRRRCFCDFLIVPRAFPQECQCLTVSITSLAIEPQYKVRRNNLNILVALGCPFKRINGPGIELFYKS